MSENYKFQISVKIDGVHLFNVRGDTAEEFGVQLKWAVDNAEQINLACTALQGPEKARPAPPPSPTGRPPVGPQRGSGGELGPLVLEKVEVKLAGKDGVPFRGPLYAVRYEGSSATTFDKLIGQAALGFWQAGAPCYVTVEPSAKNPKFSNLVSIRSAVAS